MREEFSLFKIWINNIVFGVEFDYLFNVRFFIPGKKSVIVVFVASGVDERWLGSFPFALTQSNNRTRLKW